MTNQKQCDEIRKMCVSYACLDERVQFFIGNLVFLPEVVHGNLGLRVFHVHDALLLGHLICGIFLDTVTDVSQSHSVGLSGNSSFASSGFGELGNATAGSGAGLGEVELWLSILVVGGESSL